MKKSLKAPNSQYANERSNSMRQFSTPLRPLNSKHKHLEAQLAKLNAELELTSLSPTHQKNNKSSVNNAQHSRRSASRDQNPSTGITKHQSAKRIGLRRQQASLGPPASSITISPIAKNLSRVSEAPDGRIVQNSTTRQKPVESQSFQEKKLLDSRSLIETSSRQNISVSAISVPKSGQIHHTASVQYYSNLQHKAQPNGTKEKPAKKKINTINDEDIVDMGSLSDSDRIINVSSSVYEDQKKDFEPLPPGVNTLHEGIQFLQTNLKHLEGKYNDLAKLYKDKDRPSTTQLASPAIQGKSGPKEEKKTVSKSSQERHNPSQTNLLLEKKSMIEEPKISIVMDNEFQKLYELQKVFSQFKSELHPNQGQNELIDKFKIEIISLFTQQQQNQQRRSMNDQQLQDLIIQMEYSFAEHKETAFQIKHLSESTVIDLKKTIQQLSLLDQRLQESKPIQDIVFLIGKSKEKLRKQDTHFFQMDKFQQDLIKNIQQFQNYSGSSQKLRSHTDILLQNQKLSQEVVNLQAQLSATQIAQQQDKHKLETSLSELKSQNQDLRAKIDIYNTDLRQKQLLLTQRDNQKQELSQQLQIQSQTSREFRNLQTSEERLRYTLETLAHLANRFLNAMRKLQKVVHKREPNVNQEKQDFENAKRDLEITLKSIQSSLQTGLTGRNSASDVVSELPHKAEKNIKVKQKTENTSINLKIPIQIQSDRHTDRSAIKTPQSSTPTMDKMSEEKANENSATKIRPASESATKLKPESVREQQLRIQVLKLKDTLVQIDQTQTQEMQQVLGKIRSMSQQVQSALGRQNELKDTIGYLKGQLGIQEQQTKTKEKELQVMKSELSTCKAEFKDKLKKTQEQSKTQNENLLSEIKRLKSGNVNTEQINKLVQERENILNGLENTILEKSLELRQKETALAESLATNDQLTQEIKKLLKLQEENKNIIALIKREHQIQSTKREENYHEQMNKVTADLQAEQEQKISVYKKQLSALKDTNQVILAENALKSTELTNLTNQFMSQEKKLQAEILQLQEQLKLSQDRIKQMNQSEGSFQQLKDQQQDQAQKLSSLQNICEEQTKQIQQYELLSDQLRGVILNLKTEHETVKTQLNNEITGLQALIESNTSEHDQVLQAASNAYQSELSKYKTENALLKNDSQKEIEELKKKNQDQRIELRDLIMQLQEKEDQLILMRQDSKSQQHKFQIETHNLQQQHNDVVAELQNRLEDTQSSNDAAMQLQELQNRKFNQSLMDQIVELTEVSNNLEQQNYQNAKLVEELQIKYDEQVRLVGEKNDQNLKINQELLTHLNQLQDEISQKRKLEQQIAEIRLENNKLKDEFNDAQQTVEQVETNQIELLPDEQKLQEFQIDALQLQIKELGMRLESAIDEQNKLNKQLDQFKQLNTQLHKELSDQADLNGVLSAEISSKDTQLQESFKLARDLEKKNIELQTQLLDYNTTLQNLKDSNNSQIELINNDHQTKLRNTLESQFNQHKDEIDQLKKQYEEQKNQLVQNHQIKLKEESTQYQNTVVALEQQLKQSISESEVLLQQLEQKLVQVTQENTSLKQLETKHEQNLSQIVEVHEQQLTDLKQQHLRMNADWESKLQILQQELELARQSNQIGQDKTDDSARQQEQLIEQLVSKVDSVTKQNIQLQEQILADNQTIEQLKLDNLASVSALNESHKLDKQQFETQISQLNQSLNSLQQSKETIEKTLQNTIKMAEDSEQQVKQQQILMEELNIQLSTTLQQNTSLVESLQETNNKYAELKKHDEQTNMELIQIQDKIITLQNQIDSMTLESSKKISQLHLSGDKVAKLKSDVVTLSLQHKELKSFVLKQQKETCSTFEKTFAEVMSKASDMQSSYVTQLEKLSAKYDSVAHKLQLSQSESQLQKEQCEMMEQSFEQRQKLINELKTSLSISQSQLAELKVKFDATNEQLQQQQKETREERKKNELMEYQVQSWDQIVEQLQVDHQVELEKIREQSALSIKQLEVLQIEKDNLKELNKNLVLERDNITNKATKNEHQLQTQLQGKEDTLQKQSTHLNQVKDLLSQISQGKNPAIGTLEKDWTEILSQLLSKFEQYGELTRTVEIQTKSLEQAEKINEELRIAHKSLQDSQEAKDQQHLNKLQSFEQQLADQVKLPENSQRKLSEQKDQLEKQILINLDLKNTIEQLQNMQVNSVQQLEDSLVSQNSLVQENAQLLERLRKVEQKLKETREKQSKDQDSSMNQTQETNIKFQLFESSLEQIRSQLIQAKQEVLTAVLSKIETDIEATKQAYIEDRILTHNINKSCDITIWNDKVKVVYKILIDDETYLLVQTVGDKHLYLLKQEDLHESAYHYLQSFAAESSAQLNFEDETQVNSLKELIQELCRDLIDLHQEFSRFANETNQNVDLNLVELKDEVQFLQGENRDLNLKVKQLSVNNAQLKLQLIGMTQINLNQNDRLEDDEQGYIETARNISDMAYEDEDLQKEQKEQTDFLSDQESFRHVVGGMNQLDSSMEKRLEIANEQIKDLQEKLKKKSVDQSVEEDESSTTIAHIKGTLIQFLKTSPYTDKQSEELLKIIFSMMQFSQAEIIELQNQRHQLKGNNKAVQQSVQNSSSKQNTSGVSSEGDKRVKKGIMGLFTKTKQNINTSGSYGMSPGPQQPIKR